MKISTRLARASIESFLMLSSAFKPSYAWHSNIFMQKVIGLVIGQSLWNEHRRWCSIQVDILVLSGRARVGIRRLCTKCYFRQHLTGEARVCFFSADKKSGNEKRTQWKCVRQPRMPTTMTTKIKKCQINLLIWITFPILCVATAGNNGNDLQTTANW